MKLPEIVYLQTTTQCNGHCVYCPFDDVYQEEKIVNMSFKQYRTILEWLKSNNYTGRIGFLLHYEPTLEKRMDKFIEMAREILPRVKLEALTNGIIEDGALNMLDLVDIVPAGAKKISSSRAGNVKMCEQIKSRPMLARLPCPVPKATMCIAANGDVLLCCQDWRHEAVVGNYKDLTAARNYQMSLQLPTLEICQDCMAGKTAEEVGERLGKRSIENTDNSI